MLIHAASTQRNARFELTGEADLAREQVQLTARGELPLRALNPFLDGAALTGTGSVEIGARGDWSDPAATSTGFHQPDLWACEPPENGDANGATPRATAQSLLFT